MRAQREYNSALYLVDMGLNDCQIGRVLAIPRGTVRDWRRAEVRHSVNGFPSNCPRCDGRELDEEAYAYLLGLYLGDGCLSRGAKDVLRLRITLDVRYPGIIESCREAIDRIRSKPTVRAGVVSCVGCVSVNGYWKHWSCLFPQHGSGKKHERTIRLEPWQEAIVRSRAKDFLRGLVHSDGCRDLNLVKGKSYPRYQFVNHSDDIRHMFCDTCDQLAIHWTQPYWKTISIARRGDVAFMDEFIGPKK